MLFAEGVQLTHDPFFISRILDSVPIIIVFWHLITQPQPQPQIQPHEKYTS